jgi:hypothetical protein
MLTNEGWNNLQSYDEELKEKDKKFEKVEHKDGKCHNDPCDVKECYDEDKTMCKCDRFIADASKAMVYALQLERTADATADKSLEEKAKAEELSKRVSCIAKEITPVLDEAIKFYDMAYGLADKAINQLLKASKCFDECPSLELCPALDKCKDKDEDEDQCKDAHEDKYEDKCEGKFKCMEKCEDDHKDKYKDQYEYRWEDKSKDNCKDKYEDECEHKHKDNYEWKPVSGASVCEELVDVVKCLQRKAKCLEKLADKKEEEARKLLCKANEADKAATDAFERAYNLIQKAFSIDNFANKLLSDAYALGLKAYDCCKDSKRKVDKDHGDYEDYDQCYCNFEFDHKDKGNNLLCKCDQFIIELKELVSKAKKINEKADCEIKEACEQLEVAKKAAKVTEKLREKANEAIIEVAKINNEVAKLQNKAYNEAIKAYKCFKCCAKRGRFGYNTDCDCCERFVKEAECLIEKSNEVLEKANCKIEEAIKLSHIVSVVQKKEFDAWNKAICLINEAFKQNAKAQDAIYCGVIPNLLYGYQCCKAD